MKKLNIEAILRVYDESHNLVTVVDLTHIYINMSRNKDFPRTDGAYGNIELYAPLDKELYDELNEYLN